MARIRKPTVKWIQGNILHVAGIVEWAGKALAGKLRAADYWEPGL